MESKVFYYVKFLNKKVKSKNDLIKYLIKCFRKDNIVVYKRDIERVINENKLAFKGVF